MLSKVVRGPLRLQANYRQFSSVKAKIMGNSVYMPESFMPTLPVPIPGKANQSFEFSLNSNQTLAEFQQKVVDYSDGKISAFEFVAKNEEVPLPETISGLNKQRFKIRVNKQKVYDVYPDLQTMMFCLHSSTNSVQLRRLLNES